MDKLREALDSSHEIINIIVLELEKENPEFRDEGFKWINLNIDGIKQCNHAEFPKPLVACLLDKKADIRNQAGSLIELIMGQIGYAPF